MVRSPRAAGRPGTRSARRWAPVSKAAWEAHNRWIEEQARQHELTGYQGFNPDEASAARAWPQPD
jgi:hypothetical protein